jgi:transcriptional regulator with GAF, ATPase, and Fis domain
MQLCPAWLQNYGCSQEKEAEVRAELIAAGITFAHRDDCQFGIVCFANTDEALFSLLQSAAGNFCRVVAVATNPLNTGSVWRLLEAGAEDALAWTPGGKSAEQICVKLKRWSKVDCLVQTTLSDGVVIGESPIWSRLVRRIVEAACFSSVAILLTGESGTGKEALARLISKVTRSASELRHELVTVDCGTLAPELSGSEFFGHERGAFTGAYTARDGAFALAAGATLLLDEIGDIPLSLQPQILRCIQEQTFKPLGSNVWQKTDFRLVSATNRNLEQEIERGAFRQDLYYRIAGYVFRTPPLRERRQDILPLTRHFLGKLLRREAPNLDVHVRDYLLNRAYPGNVRELYQLVQRISARYSNSGPITVGDLPEEDRPASGVFVRAWPNERFERSIGEAVMLGTNLKQISQVTAQTAMRVAIELERGNIKRAATRLGVTDRAIQMRRATGQLGCREEDDLRVTRPKVFEPSYEGSPNPVVASPVSADGVGRPVYENSTSKLAAAVRQ